MVCSSYARRRRTCASLSKLTGCRIAAQRRSRRHLYWRTGVAAACTHVITRRAATTQHSHAAASVSRALSTASHVCVCVQVFIESEGNVFRYVGTWATVQELLDAVDIPDELLAKHSIKTFDTVSPANLYFI
jgi:hypothetical protein